MTYQTVIAVCYPELVTVNLRFQFTCARDAKSSLAVLHNQNDMVTHFKASSWVSEAQGAVVEGGYNLCRNDCSYSDSCTNQSRLPYRRPKSKLPCLATGRARYPAGRNLWTCHGSPHSSSIRGLLSPANVIGSLMYGAGHVFKSQANFYLHDDSLKNSPPDAEFGRLLDRSNCLTSSHLPPLVIAEALQDYVSHWYKIRRLHLIVVDTWSPWQYNTGQVKAVTDLMKHLANTPEMQQMIPMMPQGGNVPPRCRRFIYGHALDHSEFPCYLLWPCRDQGEY